MCSLHGLEQFLKKNIFRQGKIRFSKGQLKSCHSAGYLDNPHDWAPYSHCDGHNIRAIYSREPYHHQIRVWQLPGGNENGAPGRVEWQHLSNKKYPICSQSTISKRLFNVQKYIQWPNVLGRLSSAMSCNALGVYSTAIILLFFLKSLKM